MNKKTITRIILINDSVAVGANKNAFEVMESMTNTLENLSSDGQQVKLKNLSYHVCIHGPFGAVTAIPPSFVIQPVVVQSSSGSVADAVSIAEGNIATIINNGVSDEFGFQKLGNLRTSKPKTGGAGGGSDVFHYIKTIFRIPGNIIALLNKQINTERLQDLFACFTIHTDLNISVYYSAFAEYEWEMKSK
jgi:hypothetical protein